MWNGLMLSGDELTLVSLEEGLKQVLRLHPEGHRVSFSSLPLHGADQRAADAHLLLPKRHHVLRHPVSWWEALSSQAIWGCHFLKESVLWTAKWQWWWLFLLCKSEWKDEVWPWNSNDCPLGLGLGNFRKLWAHPTCSSPPCGGFSPHQELSCL